MIDVNHFLPPGGSPEDATELSVAYPENERLIDGVLQMAVSLLDHTVLVRGAQVDPGGLHSIVGKNGLPAVPRPLAIVRSVEPRSDRVASEHL